MLSLILSNRSSVLGLKALLSVHFPFVPFSVRVSPLMLIRIATIDKMSKFYTVSGLFIFAILYSLVFEIMIIYWCSLVEAKGPPISMEFVVVILLSFCLCLHP